MRFTVAKNIERPRLLRLAVGLALVCSGAVGLVSTASAQSSNTMVAATVCEAGSTITLTQPPSDSTTTQPSVQVAGTVKQANQIEIYIDDVFDGIVPLSVGQTTFAGQVQISQGTHTIKVVAVNICPGPSGSASSVVTYEPPPNTGGEGGGTDTTAGQQPEPEPVSTDKDVLPVLPFVPPEAKQVFEEMGQWLNIAATYEGPAAPRLTLARATTIAIGSWLLAFGIATTVVQWLGSTLPIFSEMPSTRRTRIISWIIRGIGLVLVIGGVFL